MVEQYSLPVGDTPTEATKLSFKEISRNERFIAQYTIPNAATHDGKPVYLEFNSQDSSFSIRSESLELVYEYYEPSIQRAATPDETFFMVKLLDHVYPDQSQTFHNAAREHIAKSLKGADIRVRDAAHALNTAQNQYEMTINARENLRLNAQEVSSQL